MVSAVERRSASLSTRPLALAVSSLSHEVLFLHTMQMQTRFSKFALLCKEVLSSSRRLCKRLCQLEDIPEARDRHALDADGVHIKGCRQSSGLLLHWLLALASQAHWVHLAYLQGGSKLCMLAAAAARPAHAAAVWSACAAMTLCSCCSQNVKSCNRHSVSILAASCVFNSMRVPCSWAPPSAD